MPEPNLSISSFKKFLLRLLLPLVAMLAAFGIVFDYFFQKEIIMGNEISGAYKVNRIIKEHHPDEIPIFGSSMAECDYIPDSLGSRFFNYGIFGTLSDVMLFFLGEECKKTKSTPWIIVDLSLDGLHYDLGHVVNYLPNTDYKPVVNLMGNEYRNHYRIPYLRYYGYYDKYISDYAYDKLNRAIVKNKGAMIEMQQFSAKRFKVFVAAREKTTDSFRIEPKLEDKLFGLIEACPGRAFIFVTSPYHKSYFAHYNTTDEMVSFFNRLKGYKNVSVLDFSKMPLADSLFYNTTHLNYNGAIVFSHCLKDSLTALGVK